MSKQINRLDANETVFFKRELEYVKKKTYDKKYRMLKAKQFIPVSTEIPSGADTHTWVSYGKVGVAKIVADYAHDFPRVDLYGEEVTSYVRSLGDSYGYSIKEIRRAQMKGMPLSQRKANTARQAMEELMDRLAWVGDANANLQGFLNYPGITEATLTTGTGGNTWALKTPDEIIADLTALKTAVSVPTNGVEEINQILLPRTQYELIANKRMTDGDSTTVLNFFKNNNPSIMVDVLDQLDGYGDSGADRMIGYVRDPDHLTQEIPQMFEQFEADKQGAEYVIPCHAEFAGVNVYYPQSVAYMDGI